MTRYTLTATTLDQLAAQSTDLVLVVDNGGTILRANHQAEALGTTPEALHGQSLQVLTENAATAWLRPLWDELCRDGAHDLRRTVDTPAGDSVTVLLIQAERQPAPPAASDETSLANMMRAIVHELKVPISAIKSFLDLVDASGELNAAQQKFMQRTYLSLEAMVDLVHELLDMAWLESDGALKRDELSLNRLVHHAVAQLEGFAQRQNVTLYTTYTPEVCLIRADERRLHGAILNLISNAIKYSPQGGDVFVSVNTSDNRVGVSVRDHGLGISDEHLDKIFEPFYRVREPETQRIEGSGLGLGIFRAVVERHGGEIFVESTPGQGSTFGFWLPCGNADS